MKFLLTSAGIKNDYIAQALSELAGKPLNKISFLFVPTAANVEVGNKDWLINDIINFQKQNFKSIDIVDIVAVPPENWKPRFESANVICFGGGNEQYLAKMFRELGIKDFLNKILEEKVYMGISAGSMVAGQFLFRELLQIVYPEDKLDENLEPPLGFVNLYFIPHLNSEWFTHIRKEVLENLKDKLDKPLYALDDEMALKVKNNQIEIVGKGDSWVFNK